jgi:hypothetical protein
VHLITAVRDRALRDLVVVCNSLGAQLGHPVTLVERGQARKLVAAFSARAGGVVGLAPGELGASAYPAWQQAFRLGRPARKAAACLAR